MGMSSAGTLGFGLARETEVMCGVRKADGTYERMSYTFGAKDIGWEKEVGQSCEIFDVYYRIRIDKD